jgi:hypothetical protein
MAAGSRPLPRTTEDYLRERDRAERPEKPNQDRKH